MSDIVLPNRFTPRDYQVDLMRYVDGGGKRAVCVWHRRSGKDTTMAHQICKMMHQRRGVYWHMLPTQRQCRKVIWDAFTSDGERLIDRVFPQEIRAKPPNSTEMKIELACGSIYQLVGSDNYDSLVGSNPIGVVFSEWSLTDPKAWELIRPILRENGGWAVFIYTPRGYNHGWDLAEVAQDNDDWFYSLKTIENTGVLTSVDMDEERKAGMPDELVRQEYYCDFASANVGSILGSRIEEAARDGRITNFDFYDPAGAPIEVSSDIGFRDTSSWWFWQRRPDGFALIGYDGDSGLDAEDWIIRIKEHVSARGWNLGRVWLPHDAAAKTFATKHSAQEQFMRSFPGQIKVLPTMRIADRINAARTVMQHSHFNAGECKDGLAGLRAWAYEWDDQRKMFSKEPDHNWASHPGDAFSYGAVIMQKYLKPDAIRTPAEIIAAETAALSGAHYTFNLEQLFQDHEASNGKVIRLH
jgi:phage terminase large subunit